MKCYFITGVSAGIGEALVKELLSQEDEVMVRGCSRRMPENIRDDRFHFYPCDLSSPEERAALCQVFFTDIPSGVTSLVLINNAGTLGHIGFAGTLISAHYEQVISTNLIAPMLLSEAFINHFQAHTGHKVVLNISSGAAQKDYAGWAAYCASKAALDRFSTVVSLEQETMSLPVVVRSFAPGVVHTAMQKQIRDTKEQDFPSLNRFLTLHAEDSLLSPVQVAKTILQGV